MSEQGPDEPVLARAVELYAEGIAMEESNEPHLALDRYRRAVRMADERAIVARLQSLGHASMQAVSSQAGAAPAGTSGTVIGSVASNIPAAAPAAAEEEFRLWQALHISRLEAEVQSGSRGSAESAAGADAGAARSGATLAEQPKAKQRRASGASGARQEAPGVDAQEEDIETLDRIALQKVRGTLKHETTREGEAARGNAVPAAGAKALASTGSVLRVPGVDASGGGAANGDADTILTRVLPEVLPDVFAYLDPYALDRVAPVCSSFRQMSRGANMWHTLARQGLSKAQREAVGPPAGGGGLGFWRRVVLLAPRFRTDGIYIAPCGYRRRVQKGANLNDSRETMLIRYFRLLRVLPKTCPADDHQQVLILTHDGELVHAVEALKTHPAAAAATFSPGASAEAPGNVRKLYERVHLGTCQLDVGSAAVSVRFADTRNDYVAELRLLSAGPNRQNCRLSWVRYEFTSLKFPEDSGTINLQKEQHYAPYAFARVRSLEHVW